MEIELDDATTLYTLHFFRRSGGYSLRSGGPRIYGEKTASTIRKMGTVGESKNDKIFERRWKST